MKSSDGGWVSDSSKSDSSIWNFHVWVDAWMTRPDIPNKEGDGWQAIDGTPQEQSKGPAEAPFNTKDYRCGPAPLSLIKAFQRDKMDFQKYDVAFVAGEANCEKIEHWQGQEYRRTDVIGEKVMTKLPDSRCNGETLAGGKYVRLCKLNLARSYSKVGSFLQIHNLMRRNTYQIQYPNSGIRLGKPFTIKISAGGRNKLAKAGGVDYSLTLAAKSYNSKTSFGVLKTVKGGGPDGISLTISAADWGAPFFKSIIPSKTETFDLIFTATPKSGKKGESYFKRVMFSVKMPRLAIDCGDKARHYAPSQAVDCSVQFYNPLPYQLDDAVVHFTISGQWNAGGSPTGQQRLTIQPSAKAQSMYDKDIEDVDPLETQVFHAHFQLNGAKGLQSVVAKLTSKELPGVAGVYQITVGGGHGGDGHGGEGLVEADIVESVAV
jgi:hypothetical protein